MNLRLILVFFVFVLVAQTFSLWAQEDSIVMLNGKVYRGNIDTVKNGILTYVGNEKKKQGISIDLSTDRIFSYTQSGKETVLYVENEFVGDFLSVEEARRSTLGSYDARQTFKPRFVFYSSLLIGLGVSILDTYYSQAAYDRFVTENGYPPTSVTVGIFGARPTLMPVFVPITLTVGWAIPTFRIKDHQLLQKNLYGDESYYRGFHRVAKQKRIFAALSGSAIGIASGMISYLIFTPN